MEIFLWFVFAVRPIIDLFWDIEIIKGINFAGLIALAVVVIGVLYSLSKRTFPCESVGLTGILFVVYTFFVTLIFHNSWRDFEYVIRMCSGLVFFFVARSISKRKLEKVLLFYIAASMIPILLTYLQTIGIVDYTYYDYISGIRVWRGSGGYRQPSALTRVCIFGMIYTLYFLETRWKSGRQRKLAYLYIFLNLVAVLLSYHRTGYLLAVVALVLWIGMQNKLLRVSYFKNIILLGCAGVFLFVILYLRGTFSLDLSMFQELLSFKNVVRMENGKYVLWLRGRGNLIAILLRGFSENPWYNTVLGTGSYVNKVSGIGLEIADMNILRVFWNDGIIGGIIWISHLKSMWKKVRTAHLKGKQNPLGRMEICIILICVIWGFTLETTNTPNILYHFYFISGYILKEMKQSQFNEIYSTQILAEKECI